jgi:hypothetical protein
VVILGALFGEPLQNTENAVEDLGRCPVAMEPLVVLFCIRDGRVHQIVGGVNVIEITRGTEECVRPR